jgi:hypothetical protein
MRGSKKEEDRFQIKNGCSEKGAHFFYDGQHGLGLVGRGRGRGEALGYMRIGYAHWVVSTHRSLLLRLTHRSVTWMLIATHSDE